MNEHLGMFDRLYAELDEVGATNGPVSGQVEVEYATQEPHYVDMTLHAADNGFRTVTRIVTHEPGLPVAATVTQVSEIGGMVDTSHGILAQQIDATRDAAMQYEAIMGAVELHPVDAARAAHVVMDMLVDAQAFAPNEQG